MSVRVIGMPLDGKNPLHQLAGSWSGEETIATTPWGPGGSAKTTIDGKIEVGGRALSQRIRSRRHDGKVFEALSVLALGSGHGDLLFYWFDMQGFVPDVPGSGHWNDAHHKVLELIRMSPRGKTRHTFRVVSPRIMGLTLESTMDGTSWIRVMEGEYHRT